MTRHSARRPFARPIHPATRGVRWHRWAWGLGLLGTLVAPCAQAADAAPAPEAAASAAAIDPPSALDAPMFYQVIVGEMEAQAGRLGNAYEIMLDAARRLQEGALFQRAVELAVQGRSGEQALAAARAWRQALPASIDATRTVVQMLAALDKTAELGEPLRGLLQQADAGQRAAMITGLPRFLDGGADKARALAAAEQALAPYLQAADTRTAARVALGRIALAAGQSERALSLARQAQADEPTSVAPVLLAVELMPTQPAAETLVQAGLTQGGMPPALRMAYARSLEQRQRIVEAVAQMQQALQEQPELPQGWLNLGAALLDLHRPAEAATALRRALADAEAAPEAGAPDTAAQLRELIWQLLAQAAEQLGDDRAAADWLARIPAERVTLSVLGRQAGLMARQGHLADARRLLREAPAADSPAPSTRLLAEVQLLRNQRRWSDASALLQDALRRSPDDTTLLYEQAMLAERLNRFDEMETLLRRVSALRPQDAQAYNALGYSLAERGVRLDEAGRLIQRALELAPADPYITDSLGWLEFRLGHLDEAERLLRRAWGSRPHPEVAAHLGEVLWAQGRRDDALAIWRAGLASAGDLDSLRETLTRLKVPLP